MRTQEETNYLDPFHTGFRPGFSTEIVMLIDDLWQCQDEVAASIHDLSAVFDAINPVVCLNWLYELEIGGTILWWFFSFLWGWLQWCWLGKRSFPSPFLCEVIQSSTPSICIFYTYIKLLGAIIYGFGVQHHPYADNTQLYLLTLSWPGI